MYDDDVYAGEFAVASRGYPGDNVQVAETYLHIRWPDDSISSHYCPSHVVKKFLIPGEQYPVTEFIRLSRQALELASERVRVNLGYPCGRAFAAIRDIEGKAAQVQSDALVRVESFEDF